MKMHVKLNLFVICVVGLNFGECNKCEDVYKCVSDWIVDALSSNTNFKADTIEDVSKSTKIDESNDSLLTDLTRFVVDKFPNLFKEGRLLEVVGNKTKIYIQTIKINDSMFDDNFNGPVTLTNPDLINNDDSDMNRKQKYFYHDKIDTIKKNSDETLEINSKHDSVLENKSVAETTTPIVLQKDGEYAQNETVDIGNELETTTIRNPEIKINYSATKDNATIIENQTIKSELFEKNYTTYSKTVHPTSKTKLKNVTHSTIGSNEGLKTSALENLDSNVGLPTTTQVKKITHSTIGIDDGLETWTLGNSNSNDDLPTTTQVKDKDNASRENIDTQGNAIAAADIVFDDIDNEIEIGELLSDNLTDYLDIDYVEIYKDTTNEDVEFTPPIYTTTTTEAVKLLVKKKPDDGIDSVYPWIATLFIMNPDNNQFEYVCDGILVSQRAVLTAARCVIRSNATIDAVNILVILGKRSLQANAIYEILLRVKYIKVHENFTSTDGKVDNDLAIVVLAENVTFNHDVQPAPIGGMDTSGSLLVATTGWHVSGILEPLYLTLQTSDKCARESDSKNIICTALGDSETTCPSFGGVLIDRQADNQWRIKGITTGNPTNRGVCFNKDLAFTRIENYLDWITKTVKQESK